MSDSILADQQVVADQQAYQLQLKKAAYLNNLKDVIMRQTDYSEEKALEKLKEHNKDVMAIIREFMGSTKLINNKNEEPKSVNQQIYSEIRTFMDTAATSYNKKKEIESIQQQRQQQYIEQARKELERRTAQLVTTDVQTPIITTDVQTPIITTDTEVTTT